MDAGRSSAHGSCPNVRTGRFAPRSSSHQPWPHTTRAAPRGGTLSTVSGRMTPASRSPVMTAPHPPTWMLLIARQSRPLHPTRAPSFAQVWFWAAAEQTKVDRGLVEDVGSAADRAPSSFAAFLLGRWMAVSSPASASTLASCLPDDGSLPLASMGGGRCFLGRRRGLRPHRSSPWPKATAADPEDSAELHDTCYCLSYSHR